MYRYCLSGPWHSFCTRWNEAQIFLSLLAACSLSVFHSRICTCHHNPKVFKSCSAHWFHHKITTNQQSRQDCQFEAIARRPLAVVSSLHLEFVCGMNTSFNTCCWCIATWPRLFFSMQRALWHGWRCSPPYHTARHIRNCKSLPTLLFHGFISSVSSSLNLSKFGLWGWMVGYAFHCKTAAAFQSCTGCWTVQARTVALIAEGHSTLTDSNGLTTLIWFLCKPSWVFTDGWK